MDTLRDVIYGFSIGLQPANLLFCFVGVLLGTLVGVLPGIGPIGAISILLPASFRMDPTPALIMLAGIYYGAMYGGSTTSILVRIPGEAASVVTCLDGYEMAKQGRAGPALGIAAFGSFVAGTLGLVGLIVFSEPLAEFGLKFGPPEYFAVVLLGLSLITYLSSGSKIRALMMGAFGLILSCIGIDRINASPRMTFNLLELWDGVHLAPVAMGLFGIAEVLENMEKATTPEIIKTKIRDLFPTVLDWMQSKGAIIRGSLLGFFIGVLPGGSTVLSSFISYTLEKKISKNPDRFGKGAIEGVAGPESANNAACSGAFIPFFTLGIPPNVTMALLFGALVIHGLRPGPLLLSEHPDLFWGVVGSMYIGNVMLLVLNLPLIPVWVKVLKIPKGVLFPLILLFCLIGSYSVNNSVFNVFIMFIFGFVGYLFRKFNYEAAPLILALVLGPMLELNLRQSLMMSDGSLLIFFTRPISGTIVIFTLILLFSPILSYFVKSKRGLKSLSENV